MDNLRLAIIFSIASKDLYLVQTFLEPCEETIKLSNMSQLPFNFKIISNSPPLLIVDFEDVEVSKITVEPPFGLVGAQSSVTITVKFFPGLSGEFQQMFLIQVRSNK